jgi:hypothetical protein
VRFLWLTTSGDDPTTGGWVGRWVEMSGFTIIKLLAVALAVVTALLRRRPESRWSKLLLSGIGPRTDTKNMGRGELLRSSAAFLKFMVLSVVVGGICAWGLSAESSQAEMIGFGLGAALAAIAVVVAGLGGLWLGFHALFLRGPEPQRIDDESAPSIDPK